MNLLACPGRYQYCTGLQSFLQRFWRHGGRDIQQDLGSRMSEHPDITFK